MVKKIHAYLSTRGMTLMVGGFAVAVSGLLCYIYNMNNLHNPVLGKAAHATTIAGFCIYVIGRIYVAIKRHRDKTSQQRPSVAKDDEL